MFLTFSFVGRTGSKAHDNSSEQDGMDAKDHSDLQALQNHNLLIALGGVARGGTPHFPMSVSVKLILCYKNGV